MLNALTQGFFLGLSLILAIGAQNAFVLKQGLKGQHIFPICLACAVSDAILIGIGVFALQVIENYLPAVSIYARYFGAIFLFVYGAKSFLTAFNKSDTLEPEGNETDGLIKTLLICLALTWLNPHVYLDTVILLGSISTQYGIYVSYFALGAMLSSFVFFFSLGYGATKLRPLFNKPFTWKVLDVFIGIIMWSIAAGLLFNSV